LAREAAAQLLHGNVAGAQQRLNERLLLQFGQRGDDVELTHFATEFGDTTQLAPIVGRGFLFEKRLARPDQRPQAAAGHPELMDVGLVGTGQARQVAGQCLLVPLQGLAQTR
jgi:hypothetical protein